MSVGAHVAGALVGIEPRRVVAWRLARLRVVDPKARGRSDVEVHERAARVVADADVPERAAVVTDGLVRNALDAEVDRVADVVVRVRGVLRRRVRSEPTDDIDLSTAEVVRHDAEKRHQSWFDRVRLPVRIA